MMEQEEACLGDEQEAWRELSRQECNEELFDWSGESEFVSLTISTEAGVPDSELTPEEVLKRYWGYDVFRPLQRDIVQSVLDGHDTMGLLPTGGGKSVCFQVPGLIREGITLVITPLISLMKDQVDHLRQRGIKAMAIHSGMHSIRIQQAIDNCVYGRYKFLYISPERLSSERFRRQLETLEVGLLVIDECHCICQWGYDFRPSYLNILELRTLMPEVPILALTATATPDVEAEIKRILAFGDGSQTFRKSFYRSNLSYSIRHTDDKERMMLHILSRVPGSAIVYCRSRELCGQMARYLRAEGVSATHFHAGLTHTERTLRQERWMRGEVRVMVATNAFGMGIDKPDVRLVIHLMMPASIEEYFQEAGRAGRDEQRSYSVVLVSSADATMLSRRLTDSFPPMEYIYHTYEQLCSYLGIGEGEGYEHSYDFEYGHFVRVCHMRPVQTRSAIDIMQVAGWLTYHEDETRSRLMIVTTREQLYEQHVGHDELLRTLLRLYTGLFSDYVFINELDIAHVSGFTPEEVYGMLMALGRMGVLHYIPRSNIPRIVFHVRREAPERLLMPASAYSDRYKRMKERITYTKRYIQEDGVCRSRMLISYFGEQTDLSCGQCDVCLQRVGEGLKQYIVNDTREALHMLIAGRLSPPTLTALCQSLPHHPDDVLTAVGYLMSEEPELEIKLIGNLLIGSRFRG